MPKFKALLLAEPSTSRQNALQKSTSTLEQPKRKRLSVDKSISASSSVTPLRKRKQLTFDTSPRKTRGIHRKEDLECESCGEEKPLLFFQNCSNCHSLFHLTCLGLQNTTIIFLKEHPSKFRCPRCICCAKCNEYIDDAENVQCELCARAFHGACRPKKGFSSVFPNTNWKCDKCLCSPKSTSLSPQKTTSPKQRVKHFSGSPTMRIKRELNGIDCIKRPDFGTLLSLDNLKDVEESKAMFKKLCSLSTTPVKQEPGKKRDKRRLFSNAIDEELQMENARMDEALIFKNGMKKVNLTNQWVYFGEHIRFKPIYESSYPGNIQNSPNVYVCDFCLRAIYDICQFKNHLKSCSWKHPPGNEIYREERLNIWEVEGSAEKVYCRNLCLLAKFFLSSKTLYHEVETFTFYILTEITDRGCLLAGYFSKEKNPSKNNNLSCLLTLPSHQSKGYGKMLIDLSYRLSTREHKIGSPEHPLSDMGLLAYRSYWKSAIICALRKRRNQHSVSIKDLSVETAIHSCDIISTLFALKKIVFKNDCFNIDTNLAFNASLSSFRRRTINPDLLLWEPEYDVDRSNRMNSYASD